ncbi:hypothetical protein P421_11205 [Heyndrickxia coagulans P38]|nr:hypothetical protein P421_11205 [Heyndrickxia coagulans P38]
MEPGQTRPSQHATASVTKLLQKLNKKVALIVAAIVVLTLAGILIHHANSPFHKAKGYWYDSDDENYGIEFKPDGKKQMAITTYEEGKISNTDHVYVSSYEKDTIHLKDPQDEEYTVVMKLEGSSHMSLSYVDEDGELADDVIHLVKMDK